MPLTQEQFQKAKAAGFTTDQIIGFEKKRSGADMRSDAERQAIVDRPEYQGGAMSPMNVAAQNDVKLAQRNVDNLEPAVGATGAAYNATWPVSMLAKKAIGQGETPVPEATTGPGKMLQDMGVMANPLTAAAVGLGIKGIGMGAKFASNTGKSISNIRKYAKPESQAKLADEFQDTLASRRREVIDNYGDEYEKIIGKSKNKVSLNAPLKNFVDSAQDLMQNPEFSQQIAAKNPEANKIFDMVQGFAKAGDIGEISAKEADNLSKFINKLPSIKSKLAQGRTKGWHTVQWTNEDRMLLGLSDDIKSSVIDTHPELGALNKDYGKFMSAYRTVAPDFKIGTTVSKLKNLSQYDPQKMQLLEGIVPKSTINKVKEFENADKTFQLLKKLGLWGAGSIGAGGLAGAGFEAMNR